MDGNTPSDQDSASGGSAASKKGASPFDNLSRDDLVKKCRGLLGIAQKAKQAKDECLEENRKLKEQLSLAETQKTADKDCLKAMQEMVSSLTEQKLNAAMKVDELEKAVAGLKREVDGAALLRDQLDKLSVENEAFQRQIKRLTDENEELLGDLSSMEAKMKEMGDEKKTVEASKVALQQELLKAKNEAALSGKEEKLIRKLKLYKNKVQEISAKVLLLKSDRKILMKTVKDYSEQVPKWQKELLKASDVLFTRIQALERENACLKKANAESLNQKHAQGSEQIMAFEEQLKQVTTEKEALEDSILCKQKVIDDMEAKNSSLNCVVAQMEEKLRLEQTENQKLSEQLVRLSEESTQNQAELRSQLDEVQARLIKQVEELEAKSSQLVDYERKLEREEEENEKSLTEAHQALSKELEQLKDSNDKKSTTISELQTVKESLEARNIDLQEQLQEAEMTRKHLAEMVEQFKIDAAQVQSQHQARLAELQELSAKQCADLEDKVRKDIEGGRNQEELQRSLEEAKRGVSTKEEELQQVQALNDALKAENENLQTRLLEGEETARLMAEEIERLQNRISEAYEQVDAKDAQLSQFEQKLRQEADENEKGRNLITEKENTFQQLQQKLQETVSTLESIQGKHDLLAAANQQLQTVNEKLSDENATFKTDLGTVQSKLELVKLENSDLLSELKEINEILKERGGVISLQLSKISELESQKTTLQQKLTELSSPDVNELKQRSQDLERQLADKETELIALRERDRSFDAQSDVMSTSTISRAEESARMRDVDDSFEEKYNKLRSLAVKLKKKVAEQTLQLQKFEKERETLTTGKNLQSLQAEYDRLLDQMEAERQGTQQREAELKDLKEQLEKQQQEIETLNQVRTELDSSSRKDKSSLETTIREYREQLQNLKREKEAFNLAKKEIDSENQKLKATLKAKEKQLSEELEAQKELKAEVEKCRLAAKKANVLNLEMEAYEKSLAELNKKLEMKKVHEKELEGTIEVQEGTIKSLKSQLTLLEQSMNAERSHSQELKKNVDLQQEKLRVSEHQRGEVNVELAQLKVEHERIKLEIESNRVELSEAVTEKDKVNSSMKAEKSKLLKQVYSLECDAEELRTKLKEKTQEVEDVRTEFASYKIRAQSVLRQNQSKEGGKERELQEEVQTLQKSLDLSQQKLQTFTQQITELSKSCDELREDKARLQSRCKELHDLLEESRLQNESLMEESRRSNLNHQEALKTQRLQNETLVSCYKKQIEELQEQHSKEVESLQVRITQATARHSADPPNDLRNNNHSIASTSAAGFGFFRGQHISDEQKINLLLMEREEGEGSESTSSNQNPSLPRRKSSNSSQQNQRTRSARDLIPLDELLNSSFDDPSVFEADPGDLRPSTSPTVELQHTKDKLTKQESRVRHLTALLAEAEQDLAKLTQLNELLKEEVRRHERAIEREKHVHNSEYLKNVIFKFLTLNSGDEKSHLVPVLNTILRLSPEETQKLNNVAQGTDGGGRGWTGILWN
nr:GRIP and coiled-coil domain-containing protein 2-like [Aedes albopictus]